MCKESDILYTQGTCLYQILRTSCVLDLPYSQYVSDSSYSQYLTVSRAADNT